MGKNMNKEIILTIRPDGAAVHLYPSHTNHSIGKHPQYSFSADGNGWREEMITNIDNHVATVPDTPTSKQESSTGNSKISIPPDAFLKAKQKPYCHEVLAIGPLYADLRSKSSFDDRKALCVKKFLERHGKPAVQELIKYLIPDSKDLSKHYSSLPSKYTNESLQLLVTIDTVFIHEFLHFWGTSYLNSKDKELDYLSTSFNNEVECNQVWRDLFLIGNQIPMSFLSKITEFRNRADLKGKDLQRVLFDIVLRNCPFPMGYIDWHKNFRYPNLLSCNHLLDCQYVLVTQGVHEHKRFPPLQDHCWINQGARRLPSNHRDRLPTASQLSKVGISFKAHPGGTSVMNYNRAKLQLDLPRLVVYEGTEDVLRNLLAYEQTSKAEGEFTMYAVIMDSLIDTQEDLAILTKARVIENHLGDDKKLVKMWNKLCTNVAIRSCQRWDKMTHDVLYHYHSPWRPMYVEFHEKFFSRPWLTTSVIAAILILILTLVQTVYTILGYY